MPVDVFPEFAPPRVEIQTEGIGMTTPEVEELITVPMEEALRGTPEIDTIRSKTVMALSSIVLIFKRGTDIMHARQLVQERLQLAATRLPAGIGPPVMLQPLSSTSRVMKIGLSSKEMSMLDLSMTAYWKINFRLMRVPGVANIAMWGERLKQLQVQVDPERMRRHGVTLNEVDGDRRGSLGFRAAGAFELGQDADRRVHRDPEPKDRTSGPSRPASRRKIWPRCRSCRRTAARSAWATWRTCCGNSRCSSATPSSTTALA